MSIATASNLGLAAALASARQETDSLFSLLRSGGLDIRPIAERHRLIFYLGHIEAFDWNQVCRAGLGMPSFNAYFDTLFEAGIDPPPGKEPADTPADWPPLAEVLEYRRLVRAAVDAALPQAPSDLIPLIIEHRYMHAETLSYLFLRLDAQWKSGPPPANQPSRPAPVNPMVDIPAGRATLGMRRDSGFGWDNEFEAHSVDVPAFRISRYKVSNGEFLDFVRQGAAMPPFWTGAPDSPRLRCVFGEIPLPLDWPVWCTQQQATAYARSRGLHLPTEAQFHRGAYGTPGGAERLYPWGDQRPESVPGNFDLRSWDPVPVDSTPESDSAFGVSQLAGNGWEWTNTVFAPFEGFERSRTYPGYSANFFDGQHYVMKGGSPRTAATLLRRSFRNWFRPDYRHTWAGFHLVENS
jgi:formylglycine-generating enzyme required for sulfatase activity